MTTASNLAGASWLAARRTRVLTPVAGVLVLVSATAPWQDTHSVPVLHGVALLTAAAVAASTDDPVADVVAATPYPRHLRTLGRLLVALAVAVPAYLVAAVVAELRAQQTPLASLTVEALVLGLAAAATGAALRDRGVHAPAYPAALGVLLLLFVLHWLPRGWVMVDPQPWGPPLEAALVRWTSLALLSAGVLALALRDPATR
jgi:hypothetical protein